MAGTQLMSSPSKGICCARTSNMTMPKEYTSALWVYMPEGTSGAIHGAVPTDFVRVDQPSPSELCIRQEPKSETLTQGNFPAE
eukprot:CAMPEP_0170629220 /NCGR_PEP_ID=MMETSP0224-20130122/33208_1 /TAXON_ID=285029 /ORGANISM="Togula jolla, Strain CCCM 725" /LENGTH=82 /DNA_ID=CAMNT_0010956911 /DNA_START=293 /DNA_END=541 /DNA_ORIENTATION=+